MAANIPGVQQPVLPGIFTNVITQSSGVSIPGGARVTAMIGQGSVNEVIVSSALGGGADGLNSAYTSTSGSDGRHFALVNFPLVTNRTTIFKNGVPQTLTEITPITTTTTFSSSYQVALDPTTGHILFQGAGLQDLGGTFYVPLTTNVGVGTVNNLTLEDQNAPPETWTVRCISVQRNALNQPIAGTALFLAYGSVSGTINNSAGNPIVWQANGENVSNGILQFNITETKVSGVAVSPFVPGDGFTIIVQSGVLVRGDSVTSTEIPTSFLNVPTLTQGITDVTNLSGPASTTNNLSLGAQLFYSNGASSMYGLLAAPPLPRRTSYIMATSVNSLSTNVDDFIFPFPLGIVPDTNSDIHVFVTNPTTNVETQLIPNKYPFYTLDTSGNPTNNQFIFSDDQPPAGYSFDYTVINSFETVTEGFDGYLGRLPAFQGTQAVFSDPNVVFTAGYAGKLLTIIDSVNAANIGTFNITGVSGGQLTIQTVTSSELGDNNPHTTPSGFPDFTSQTGTTFELVYIPTGLVVDNSNGTDGNLVAFLNTATASLTSGAINFSTIDTTPNLINFYRLKISGSTEGNNGLYDITGYNSGTNTLSIRMAFVSESNMRYEVIDPTLESAYLVLNHNVVPNGNQLRVTIVDARDAAFFDAGWLNALAALETIECDIVVPLPNQTITSIFQNALAHCIAMSNIQNRKERVLFIGAIQGLTPSNLTGATLAAVEDLGILEGVPNNDLTSTLAANIQDIANYSVANAYGETFRCVYFYPDQIVVSANGSNVLIDGFYIAAAAAGYANADTSIQNPFTNKVFSGFTILNNKMYSPLVLSQLAAAGVTTLQPVAGGGKVVWGITTSQSGFPEEQEISIVFIRDRVAKALRAGFAGFIGTPQATNTATTLNTEAVIILNAMISQGIITAYSGLTVNQDPADPRQWDISVKVQPVYPINWIYITVTIGELSSSS